MLACLHMRTSQLAAQAKQLANELIPPPLTYTFHFVILLSCITDFHKTRDIYIF